MLASDLNNKDFANPQNPDDLLVVEFYNHTALDTWETQRTGIKTYVKECPFVRISVPGNQQLTVERPAEQQDANRWPRQWLAFQMQTGMIANAENVPGWQLDQWDEMNLELVRQLKFLRFYTVEQLAGANDAQVQGIGMGGNGLREKAKAALARRNSEATNTEIAKRDSEIAELKAQMQALMEMVGEKKKPGRPRNEDREAA